MFFDLLVRLPSRRRRQWTCDSPCGSNCHSGSCKESKINLLLRLHISINNVTQEGNKTAFVVSVAVIEINQFTLFPRVGPSRWVRRSPKLLSLAAWQPRHFVPRDYSVLRSLWWAWGWLRWTNASQHADSSSTLSWHSAARALSLLGFHRGRRSPLIVHYPKPKWRWMLEADLGQGLKQVPSLLHWVWCHVIRGGRHHILYFSKTTDWNTDKCKSTNSTPLFKLK